MKRNPIPYLVVALASFPTLAPRSSRADEPVPPATPARDVAAEPGIEARLARIRAERDSALQRAAIAELATMSRDAFLALEPDVLAALAPDTLRVYDISAARTDGDDAPPPPSFAAGARATAHTADAPTPVAAGSRRAGRIAAELEQTHAGGFAIVRPETSPGAEGSSPATLLVVCGPENAFPAIEAALDRLATTGGPVIHVDVDFRRAGADTASQEPGTVVASYGFDVAHNRVTTAWRQVQHAYVDDATVRPAGSAPRLVAPVVRTWTEGFGLVARVGGGGGGADPQLHVGVAVAFAIEPVPTFTTTLGAGGPRGTVELPSLAQQQVETAWLIPVGGLVATESLLEGKLRVDVRASRAASRPLARGWSRRAASAPVASPRATVATLTARWRSADGLDRTSPRVTLPVGRTAVVSVLAERAYVAGAEVTGSGDTWIVDPVVQTVPDGVVLEATVHPATAGAHVVDGRVVVTRPDAPFRERVWEFGFGTPMRIQLPVVREASRPFRAVLRVGESATLPVPAIPGAPPASLRLELDGVRPQDGAAPATR